MTNLEYKSCGFIGLGIMGWGMATNLRSKLDSKVAMHVCDVNTERLSEWVAQNPTNVHVAKSPKAVVDRCDVIITMLPRGEHVRAVFADPTTGLLRAATAGSDGKKMFVDCSTIDVETSRQVGDLVRDSGLGTFSDAPVSGGQGGANAGTLTFMVGGTEDVFAAAEPILKLMGKPESIYHCGDAGAGLTTKLINNYMSAVNMVAVCEGMNLGELCGLNLKTLASVVNSSTGMSRNSREQNPVKGISETASAAIDFQGGFSTELCLGVLEMAVALGKQMKAKNELSDVVLALYKIAVQDKRCKGLDFRSIYRLFSEHSASAQ